MVFVLNYRFRPLSIQMMPLPDFSKKGKWATLSDKLRKYDTCNFYENKTFSVCFDFSAKILLNWLFTFIWHIFFKNDLCLFVWVKKEKLLVYDLLIWQFTVGSCLVYMCLPIGFCNVMNSILLITLLFVRWWNCGSRTFYISSFEFLFLITCVYGNDWKVQTTFN